MDLRFVLARPHDLDLLIDLMRQLRIDDPDEGPFDEAAARAAVPALLADPSIGRIWLIAVGRELAGYVALTIGYSIEFGGRTAFVDELFVVSKFRRQRIGSLALQFVEDKAKAMDVRVLFLEVTQSNAAAKEMYRKQGYVDRVHQLMLKRVGK